MFGTALLLLAVNWGAQADAIPEVVCITIFVAFVICGPVSGGHLNPAVTLGVWLNYGSLADATFVVKIIIS